MSGAIPPAAGETRGAAGAHSSSGAGAGADADAVLFHGHARHTVRVGSYLGWVALCLLLTFGGGLAMKWAPLSGYPVWATGFFGFLGIGWTYLSHVTTRFKVTRRRVELERGVLGKDVDSLELWRVLDVTFKQSPWDRVTGNAKITLVGTDRTHPELVLHGLPDPRDLFEKLRDAVQVARHTSRPVEFVGGEGVETL